MIDFHHYGNPDGSKYPNSDAPAGGAGGAFISDETAIRKRSTVGKMY
jgi:hypothetical protein